MTRKYDLLAISLLLFSAVLCVWLTLFGPIDTNLAALVTGDRIAAAVGSILGTFLGAWLAFTFATFTRNQTRNDENVAAGNLALFALLSMYNKTKQYQNEIVHSYRNRQDAWLNLPVTDPLNLGSLSLDVKSLAFVAQSFPTTFADVMLEEDRFNLVASMVTTHRVLSLEQIWPRLTEAGVKMGGKHALSELEALLGPAIVQQASVTTAGIISTTGSQISSLV